MLDKAVYTGSSLRVTLFSY